MRVALTVLAASLLLCLAVRIRAHRLDEYLLDTTFTIHPDRVRRRCG